MSALRDRAAVLVLTAGGAGLLKPAPGTWGTAVGLLLHWGGTRALGGKEWLDLPLAALFFGATWALGGAGERIFGSKDPSQVVSDEVAGYLVAVALTAGTGAGFWVRALGAFALFRLFDMAKPWPIRHFERLPGGLGIAADDAVAGVFANVVLRFGLALCARFG